MIGITPVQLHAPAMFLCLTENGVFYNPRKKLHDLISKKIFKSGTTMERLLLAEEVVHTQFGLPTVVSDRKLKSSTAFFLTKN